MLAANGVSSGGHAYRVINIDLGVQENLTYDTPPFMMLHPSLVVDGFRRCRSKLKDNCE
jgi:hypothetical protein